MAGHGGHRGRLRGPHEHAPQVRRSTTLETADWNNSTIIRDTLPDEISRLKGESSANILIGGSATLARTLLEHDLIDEVRMLGHPLSAGEGRRLFHRADGPIGQKLVATQPFDSGA